MYTGGTSSNIPLGLWFAVSSHRRRAQTETWTPTFRLRKVFETSWKCVWNKSVSPVFSRRLINGGVLRRAKLSEEYESGRARPFPSTCARIVFQFSSNDPSLTFPRPNELQSVGHLHRPHSVIRDRPPARTRSSLHFPSAPAPSLGTADQARDPSFGSPRDRSYLKGAELGVAPGRGSRGTGFCSRVKRIRLVKRKLVSFTSAAH